MSCLARCLAGVWACVCLLAVAALPALAADEQGATVCSLSDSRLNEVSGLAVTESGYTVVNDGGDEVTLYHLDNGCKVSDVEVWSDGEFNPADPEDLAITSDGTRWIADIGDNSATRSTAAVWRIAPDADPVLYRLKYPDGPHDAEAMLITDEGTPVIITKSPTGTSSLYVAAKPLTGPKGTYDLNAAGEVSFAVTDTPGGPVDAPNVNSLAVTGGAISPDGKHIAIRTYTDAYEWDVPDGNTSAQVLAQTITSAEPRRTPIPDEPQGEAIAYTADSASFLTVSEGVGEPLRQWAPAPRPAPQSEAPVEEREEEAAGTPWHRRITFDHVMGTIYIAGFLGIILTSIGIFGIVRHKKRVKNESPPARSAPREESPPATSRSATTYGGKGQERTSGGTVYGGNPSGGNAGVPDTTAVQEGKGTGGTVYGGGGGGTVYGLRP